MGTFNKKQFWKMEMVENHEVVYSKNPNIGSHGLNEIFAI